MPLISQSGALPLAALLLCVSGPLRAENLVLQEVRHWSLNGVTRVAVQLSGPAEVRRDRLFKPERYFFDFQNTGTNRRGMQTIPVGDSLIRQIRIAEARPGTARVVLDLVDSADVVTSELENPYRLIIEVRKPGAAPAPAAPAPVISAAPAPVAEKPKSAKAAKPFVPPARPKLTQTAVVLPLPPELRQARNNTVIPPLPKHTFPPYRPVAARATPNRPAAPPAASTPVVGLQAKPEPARAASPIPPGPTPSAPATAPTKPGNTTTMAGANSMTRALGLKIRRIAIDPGHGGHDQGSSGPTGLLEKELVLDVALRLGELVSANLGSEVVYTRDDDHFVPLEMRTKIANDSRADLFVSIHANSSTIRSVSGVETYFLSFTTSKEALDVAARENSTSDRSVFELRDLLQKIALQDKIDESRDFATRVNASLYRVWGPVGATRNRGVKKAPFVVLIGASMPSILTEIGFLSNPRDEKELRKPETRQKIAEALYRGIAQYADSLSHLAVARRAQDE